MAVGAGIDIAFQTLYSELVQRTLDHSFASDFSLQGRFVCVSVKNREYWYFDTPSSTQPHPQRRYVGPVEDPEITRRVEAFKDLKADFVGRRRLVSTLVREAGLPRPPLITGQVVEQLAKAGFFRMCGVLIGTVAYGCYSAVLARHVNAAAMQTGDIDFAQFREISAAVGDTIPPILDVLRQVDPTFREIPNQTDGRASTKFMSRDRFTVEFLTPNRGSSDQDGRPVAMPALGGASAYSLRFPDFLTCRPMRAALLHGAGIPVLVCDTGPICGAHAHRGIETQPMSRCNGKKRCP